MTEQQDSVSSVLEGKRVLIVEDDPDLAPRLAALFTRVGCNVVLRGCVKGKRYGGLDALMSTPFDLSVVDIMLPEDEAAYEMNNEFYGVYTKLLRKLMEAPSAGEGEESGQVPELRLELEQVTDAIRANIVVDGGISMLREYKKELKVRSRMGVLFLTARENVETRQEAMSVAREIADRVDWLSKPVSIREILEKAKALVDHKGK